MSENFELGVNLRVTECLNQGHRNHMEDFSKYFFDNCYDRPNSDNNKFAYFGVFDGHGGPEAARFAKNNLLDEIKKQEKFWSNDDNEVLQAIREGFISTHQLMWNERDNWPRSSSGFPSTAGCTASIAIVRNKRLYIGHVGDSAIVLGKRESGEIDLSRDNWLAQSLTVEHKPENPMERRRIESVGGSLMRKAGVERVVWHRPKTSGHLGPVRRSTEFEAIPFLAVARSLGDLWSYDEAHDAFHVSPVPDCCCLHLDSNMHRCLILGSDGLWNMLSPEAAVELVRTCERETEHRVFTDPSAPVNFFYDSSATLVRFALSRWAERGARADNITALVVMIDPLGKSMGQLRIERRRLVFDRLGIRDLSSGSQSHSSNAVPPEQMGVRQYLVPCEKRQNANRLMTDTPIISSTSNYVAQIDVVDLPVTMDLEKDQHPPVSAPLDLLSLKRLTLEHPVLGALVHSWATEVACWAAMLEAVQLAMPAGVLTVARARQWLHRQASELSDRLVLLPACVALRRALAGSASLQGWSVLDPGWSELLTKLIGGHEHVLHGSGAATAVESAALRNYTPEELNNLIQKYRFQEDNIDNALISSNPISSQPKKTDCPRKVLQKPTRAMLFSPKLRKLVNRKDYIDKPEDFNSIVHETTNLSYRSLDDESTRRKVRRVVQQRTAVMSPTRYAPITDVCNTNNLNSSQGLWNVGGHGLRLKVDIINQDEQINIDDDAEEAQLTQSSIEDDTLTPIEDDSTATAEIEVMELKEEKHLASEKSSTICSAPCLMRRSYHKRSTNNWRRVSDDNQMDAVRSMMSMIVCDVPVEQTDSRFILGGALSRATISSEDRVEKKDSDNDVNSMTRRATKSTDKPPTILQELSSDSGNSEQKVSSSSANKAFSSTRKLVLGKKDAANSVKEAKDTQPLVNLCRRAAATVAANALRTKAQRLNMKQAMQVKHLGDKRIRKSTKRNNSF